jgi:hypothetical protein
MNSCKTGEFLQSRGIPVVLRICRLKCGGFLDFSQGFTLTAAGPPPSAPPSPSPFENRRIPTFSAPAARGGENLRHELGVVIRSFNLEFAQSATLL